MTPQEFIVKWQKATLSERSACQQHFLDLCELLGQPKPAEADPEGAWYTFERGVQKTTGGTGWAHVWMRDCFGWEYKGKHKNLADAYQQLLLYREALENPPLLVVCDLDRFEIHTNFTGTVKKVYAFDLQGLAEPANLDVLRRLFSDPQSLRPGQTTESITRQAAERFGLLADGMRVRGIEAHAAAHFLMKLMFCMFGEDIGLLRNKVFSRILTGSQTNPPRLAQRLGLLFQAMATGGDFGADEIPWFNGGLFADADVIELRPNEIDELIRVNQHDWGDVEPSIFGTLFERTLDPAKRSQIGAHYTSRADILTLLEPVVMAPLRREWGEVQAKCDGLWPDVQRVGRERMKSKRKYRTESIQRRQFDRLMDKFVEHLAHVKILDPACGSGNFLYVSINLLLDLEKQVIAYGAAHGVTRLPQVRPTQLYGIEINPYAQQLAQVVIWIGYLQWMHHNGFNPPRNPILEPIESIRLMDAIIDLSDPEHPKEPAWPEADFIVGNPPFLGGKRLRTELGDEYVGKMFRLYNGRVPHEADLVIYWFERAREQIKKGNAKRAGLLGTQSIRMGASRKILDAIKRTGDIFFAYSDRAWILDGADVRVSLVGFDDGEESQRELDGDRVPTINANLTTATDITAARRLSANASSCFMGNTKGGAFDISESEARRLLRAGGNPNGQPNSDVVVPWCNAIEITRRGRDMWIINFGVGTPQTIASMYHEPFEHVRRDVLPTRMKNNRESYRNLWWIHVEPRPAMHGALTGMMRFVATPRVAKHRLFTWIHAPTLPDSRIYVFPRDDDYYFGVLHSRVHEVWALATSSRHGVGNDPTYNNTTCFETFPFPEPADEQRAAIAEAAKELDALRNNWLNPPEWTREEVLEFPGSAAGPWARYVVPATLECGDSSPLSLSNSVVERDSDDQSSHSKIGTVRYPRLVPKDAECAKQLKRRTLTNLYNQRPT
jgi:type II restriction/modification system DNA methylase subunit YeeA